MSDSDEIKHLVSRLLRKDTSKEIDKAKEKKQKQEQVSQVVQWEKIHGFDRGEWRMNKKEIKLEAGQIWKENATNTVRKIIAIGGMSVFYAILDELGNVTSEHSMSHRSFLNTTDKLIPCWPPKPVEETKSLVSGFAFYLDSECNLIIPRKSIVPLAEAIGRANFDLVVKEMEPVK